MSGCVWFENDCVDCGWCNCGDYLFCCCELCWVIVCWGCLVLNGCLECGVVWCEWDLWDVVVCDVEYVVVGVVEVCVWCVVVGEC